MTAESPDWPALMRPDTLRAYLDCRSDSDFARIMKRLRDRGYPGPDPVYKRHVRAVIDQYVQAINQGERSGEAQALAAISRFT